MEKKVKYDFTPHNPGIPPQSVKSHSKEKSVPSHPATEELWVDGLLCAFEFIPSLKKTEKVGGKLKSGGGKVRGSFTAEITLKNPPIATEHAAEGKNGEAEHRDVDGKDGDGEGKEKEETKHRNHWMPIGWARINELVQHVKRDSLLLEELDGMRSDDDDEEVAVADQATPFWQKPVGPIWWCHVNAGHPHIVNWLAHASWLHPAISSALRDESRLISERMKHLFYEVPVRVGGGLLFELLGQSVGDPHHNEDDVPIVLRSWTSLNFLITSLHVKGEVPNGLNVIGITEVQDVVGFGGASAPRTAHEVVALLADRLARWDDRLYRKHYFGEADEIELKFVNRTGADDLAILSIILNQEIRRLSSQVIRVKWSLHAREEILYELVAHLRGKPAQNVLSRIAKSTRNMLGEQEAVRDRLFTVQDVMQNTVRASLQDASVRIQHNLAIIGGGSLFLSIIAGLFGVNLDGIPGGANTPYAFGLFTAILFGTGALIVGISMTYLGFRKPPTEQQLESRKLELQDLVKKFQTASETHEKVKDTDHSWRGNKKQGPPDVNLTVPAEYILVG